LHTGKTCRKNRGEGVGKGPALRAPCVAVSAGGGFYATAFDGDMDHRCPIKMGREIDKVIRA